ncbi:thermonuclease family protein [Reyranella sp.]|uniref:thermonuclease family protein n=1 Tax=Reyranella sp. TaxID=1929291 RepID=UPI003BABB04D
MGTARLIAAVSLVGLSLPAVAQDATGSDVVRLNGATWRLHGIELPAPGQTCADGWKAGEAAHKALDEMAASRKLDCRNTGKDQYSRPVATCTLDGEDLGTLLVRRGLAWASLRRTWRYVLDDWIAWFNGAGVYGHKCESPADWRAHHKSGG